MYIQNKITWSFTDEEIIYSICVKEIQRTKRKNTQEIRSKDWV